jgi:hypothetical protein
VPLVVPQEKAAPKLAYKARPPAVPVVVPQKAAPPKLASSAAVVGPLAVTCPGLPMPMPPNDDAIGAAAIGATAPCALDNITQSQWVPDDNLYKLPVKYMAFYCNWREVGNTFALIYVVPAPSQGITICIDIRKHAHTPNHHRRNLTACLDFS